MPSYIPINVPTVGRQIHYWPLNEDKIMAHSQPHPGMICHVNDNGTVNLAIHNERGFPYRRCNVPMAIDRPAQSGEASFIP